MIKGSQHETVSLKVTAHQDNSKNIRTAKNLNRCACRKYLKKNNKNNYAQICCSVFKITLCKESRLIILLVDSFRVLTSMCARGRSHSMCK